MRRRVGDQRVPVRQPLRAGPDGSVEGIGRVGGVPPNSLVRAVGGAFVQAVAVAVDGQGDLVRRRIAALEFGILPTVIEDDGVARAGRPFRDPMRAVGPEEALIGDGSPLVCAGIAPAVEQVAPHAAVPPGMPRGLLCACGVIDNPNLAEVADRDHNLVQYGVVVQRIPMEPSSIAGTVAPRRGEVEIDVYAFRVVGDHAVVGLLRIEVLNEVVERRPSPDDLAVLRACWANFDDNGLH